MGDPTTAIIIAGGTAAGRIPTGLVGALTRYSLTVDVLQLVNLTQVSVRYTTSLEINAPSMAKLSMQQMPLSGIG